MFKVGDEVRRCENSVYGAQKGDIVKVVGCDPFCVEYKWKDGTMTADPGMFVLASQNPFIENRPTIKAENLILNADGDRFYVGSVFEKTVVVSMLDCELSATELKQLATTLNEIAEVLE